MKRNIVGRRAALKLLGAGAAAASGLLSSRALMAQGNANVVKLASVVSLSGAFAQYGQELQRGTQLAVDAVNSKGLRVGDRNYTIKLETFDDKSDAGTCGRLVERATGEGANFVIAGVSSLLAKAVIPIAQRQRTPIMAQWAAIDGVFAGQKGNPYFFGNMAPFSQQYDYIWDQLQNLDSPKLRKVVMVSPNDELGASIAKALPDTLKKRNMELTAVEFFPPGSQDYGATVQRCARHTPDVLLINCYAPQALAIIKEMRQVKYFPPAIVFETPTGLLAGVGDDINGTFVPSNWAPTLTLNKDEFIGTSQDFAKLYKAKHNADPADFVAACGANNVIIYAQVLARAKNVSDPNAVLAALRAFQGETFFGPVKFNDSGLNVAGKIYAAQFVQGKIKLVYPTEVREEKPTHPYPGSKKT